MEKQQLLADAQKQADEIVAAGKAAVEIERQNKLREADAQATALARSMCEKLLKHNLTARMMISCWTICCRKQVQAMATEFSREFFADNRIVKASLRCAHKLREKIWTASSRRSKSCMTPRKSS